MNRNNAGAIFLENSGITFNLMESGVINHANHSEDDVNSGQLPWFHAYKVDFVDCNKDIEIKGEYKSTDYNNYFLGKDTNQWASKVHSYYNVEYTSIYDNIDLKLYSAGNSIKYDFIVKPGGDPDIIKLKYSGVSDIKIKKSNLIIETAVNTVTEYKPFVYQIIQGDTVQINCKYKLRNSEVSFNMRDKYNPNYDLIIDPFLVFSTYSGSTANNFGYTATFDYAGNVFSGGIAQNVGYPTTIGAYQEEWGGDGPGFTGYRWDVGIIKYDSTGVERLWATYLGGTGDEMPHSMIADTDDNLYIMGTTGSLNFPVHENAYDTTFNGGDSVFYVTALNFIYGSDLFITKLSEDGSQLLGSSYVGGTENDGLNYRDSYPRYGNDSLYYNYGDGARGEILIDNQGDVLVASCTYSDDFLVQNSFQSTFMGKQEGVLFKMTDDLDDIVWSTFVGGPNDDALYSLDIDSQDNIFFAGGTNSDNLNTTTGVISQSYLGGSADGLIGKVSSTGSTLLELTYFGSDDYDQVYFVKIDGNDNVYITGQTKASGSTLIINNPYYNKPNSGQFISKLSNDLDLIEWSTVFGTGSGLPNISITAFTVDLLGRTYLSGWGRDTASGFGTTGLDVTPSAYQQVTDGKDFYIMVLSENATCLEYATFFGEQHGVAGAIGDHVDGGTSRFDKRGYIYQASCASCGSLQNFPIYPSNVWSDSNGASCNNAVFKFELESPVTLPDIHVCNEETANAGFAVNDTNITYQWSPGNLVSNASANYPQILTQDDTQFMLTMVSHYCIDTIYQSFFQHNLGLTVPESFEICDYDSVYLEPTVLFDIADVTWSISPYYIDTLNINSNAVWAGPDSTVLYYCMASNEYCEAEDSTLITVHNVSINSIPDFVICYGDSVELSAISNYPGQNIIYTWEPESVILSGQYSPNPFIFIEDTTQFFVSALNVDGNCVDTDSLTVALSPFSLSTDEIIELEIDSVFRTLSIQITTESDDSYDYFWSPPEDLDSIYFRNVIATTDNSGYFYVEVTDEFGCIQYDSIYIFVEDVYCNEDHVYLPNAFTPNGDGYNDILYVQSRMTNDIHLIIWDRWGEKVFETRDLSIGWDGTYKGQKLAPDVFVYYLQAGCWNGSRFEKKGNVTLLK